MSTETAAVEVKDETVVTNRLDSILDELESADAEDAEPEIGEPVSETPAEEPPAPVEEPPAVEAPKATEEVPVTPDYEKIVREQQRQINALQQKLSSHDKHIRENGLIPQEELDQEAEIQAQEESRIEQLRLMAASTVIMKGYHDLETVVTKERLEDTVAALAKSVAQQTGIPLAEAYARAEQHIWSGDNPWRYMYDLIKSSHSDFAEPTPQEVKKEVQAVNVPTTLANMQGGESVKSGWTADKIDALPEDKLNSVPKDIYERYLRGELD